MIDQYPTSVKFKQRMILIDISRIYIKKYMHSRLNNDPEEVVPKNNPKLVVSKVRSCNWMQVQLPKALIDKQTTHATYAE